MNSTSEKPSALTGKGRIRRILRRIVRFFFLATALLLLAGGPLPETAARAIPAASPLALFSTTLVRHARPVAWIWLLPATLVLVSALWRGRFFCRWICPLGTLYDLPSKTSLRQTILSRRLSGFLFWFLMFAAAAGLPILLFLDPLAGFSRLGALAQGSAHAGAWILGFILPLLLLLAFVQPGLWCAMLCPLGYALERIRIRKPTKREVDRTRRELLIGLATGLPAALLLRKAGRAPKDERPVLPPGAVSLDDFAGTCIRCYACVNVCPTGVLTVRRRGGAAELALPEMDFLRREDGYCEQYCNACTQICPTGALRALSIEEKQRCKIATAHVVREACLAWTDRTECLACDEFCAYNAFEIRQGKDGIAKPVVIAEKCRGCGACLNVCPAERLGKAIVITPLSEPRRIPPKEDARAYSSLADSSAS